MIMLEHWDDYSYVHVAEDGFFTIGQMKNSEDSDEKRYYAQRSMDESRKTAESIK